MSPRKKWCRGHQLRKELRFVLQILWLLVIVVLDDHVGMKGGNSNFWSRTKEYKRAEAVHSGLPTAPSSQQVIVATPPTGGHCVFSGTL